MCPDNVRIEVERFHDPLLTYEDDDLARLFGLFVAEIAVDNWATDPLVLSPADGFCLGDRYHSARRG